MGDDDKPFACTEPGCGMRFANEDHLSVHKMKHEMSLCLTPGNKTTGNLLFVDQTPTPTKFLKNLDEIGLFNELNKNPFEEAFKKATAENLATSVASDENEAAGKQTREPEYIPLPGPNCDSGSTLDTPVPPTSSEKNSQSEAMDLRVAGTPGSVPGPTPEGDTSDTVPDDSTNSIINKGDVSEQVKSIKSEFVSSVKTELASTYSASHVSPQPMSVASVVSEMTEEDDNVSVVSVTDETSQQTLMSPAPSNVSSVLSPGTPGSQSLPSPQVVPVQQVVKTHPQYMMQVLLQLPNGQTVPVHIPAAVANTNVVVTQTQAAPPSATPITTPVQTVRAVAPAKVGQAEVSTTSSVQQSMSAITKQRLKAAIITQNMQHSVLNNNMRVMTEAVDRVTSATVQRPAAILKSPVLSQPTSPSMVVQPSGSPQIIHTRPEVQTQAADTSTPFSKRARKPSDEDPDDRRRKFLERNRAAAARCRQKRKSWIHNLEKKADDMQATNVKLQNEVTLLRGEVAQLKTLLLAHKDCAIFIQQRDTGQLQFSAGTLQTAPQKPQTVPEAMETSNLKSEGTTSPVITSAVIPSVSTKQTRIVATSSVPALAITNPTITSTETMTTTVTIGNGVTSTTNPPVINLVTEDS